MLIIFLSINTKKIFLIIILNTLFSLHIVALYLVSCSRILFLFTLLRHISICTIIIIYAIGSIDSIITF